MTTANPEALLTPSDREAVRLAVEAAEVHTRGEIVPFVVGRSDDYPEAGWRGATAGALVGVVLAGIVASLAADAAGAGAGLLVALGAFIGAACGLAAAVRSPRLARRLIEPEDMDRHAHRRARQAFLEESVFATRERSGILLFLSLFERRAVVLADEGIHAVVPAEEWQSVVQELVVATGAGRLGEGLIEAVNHCGRLLRTHGVDVRPADVNEAADVLRISAE